MILALGSSPIIMKIAPALESQGYITQRALLKFVYGSIRYAPKMIALGYVSAQDIERFPRHLKILIYTQHTITVLSITWITTVLTITLAVDLMG